MKNTPEAALAVEAAEGTLSMLVVVCWNMKARCIVVANTVALKVAGTEVFAVARAAEDRRCVVDFQEAHVRLATLSNILVPPCSSRCSEGQGGVSILVCLFRIVSKVRRRNSLLEVV